MWWVFFKLAFLICLDHHSNYNIINVLRNAFRKLSSNKQFHIYQQIDSIYSIFIKTKYLTMITLILEGTMVVYDGGLRNFTVKVCAYS